MTFRDVTPTCLACASGLDLQGVRWSCEQCGSVLVPARQVEEMMNEMSPDDQRPIDQRLVDASGPHRTCPRCLAEMSLFTLHGVLVDRCTEHGIWFDSGELVGALNANANEYNDRHPRAPRGAMVPFGLGMIVSAILGPWLDRRRLRKDIEKTSPPKKLT